MCGIVGVVSQKNIVPEILQGLKKLEYRGYDSAGIALIKGDQIDVIKEQGKIIQLSSSIEKNKKFQGSLGIGHTRWATHGKPSWENSHPHASKNIAVVHNGIIENYQELKIKLKKFGVKFLSETDTEVVPHLISFYLEKFSDKKKAVFSAIKDIRGTFALAIIFQGEENLLVGAKKGSPLLIGYGNDENYLASDFYAIDDLTSKVSYLEDGDIVFLSKEKVEIFDAEEKKVKREIKLMEKDFGKISKENFPHFMLKEIFEQPRVVQDSIETYLDLENGNIHLPNFSFDIKSIEKITIVACGTSYYAGMVGKYLIESLSDVPCEVDIASEYRYRDVPFHGKNNLVIFISQSGETADSLAALKFAKENNQKTLAIVNVVQSNMAYHSDGVIRTVAGLEIGVASTKAYTAQLMVLILFAMKLGEEKEFLDRERKNKLIIDIARIPSLMQNILQNDSLKSIKSVAKYLSKAKNILYMGRGISFVTALEGALKLKELSYINSFGIAAGELKHGTIALVDSKMPIIAIAPHNNLFEKTASNIEEVAARGGKIILISDDQGIKDLKNVTYKSISLPKINNIISESLLSVIPTQLIAYYASVYKGNDVDQPRNLAKSVTVE